MTTIRKIISYDDIEDKDIKDWLNSLPVRQQSKYIRVAIRHYISNLADQDEQRGNSSHLIEGITEQKEYLSHLIETITEQKEYLAHIIEKEQNSTHNYSRSIPKKSTKRKHSTQTQTEQHHDYKEEETKDDSYVDLDENVLDDLGK